ncbi:DUF6470 family protein [Alkalicoccus chagannorensis]|uniref:DUF6470 family protein n=1 Tax=Alkalicoccus chagannorensis TaxID=427072 RepID=UPI0004097787|nr:DUF6470 family protein [Alkalicoccus chagannorensis]
MRIEIDQTMARLGMSSQRPPMQIENHDADMTIDQELQGNMTMSSTDGQLDIDQTAAFADADIKSILVRNEEYAARANQNVMAYVAKTAQEGRQLQAIEQERNVIADLAREKGMLPVQETGYGTVPTGTEKVRISYTPGEQQIDFDWPDPVIDVQPNPPEIDIPRWETSVYLEQQNSIQFRAVGGAVDMRR